MSSSRSRNFRRRSETDDTNGDDKPTTTTTSKPQTLTQQPQKPKNPRPSSGPPKRLSFADDEDEDDDSSTGPTTLRRRPPLRPPPPPVTGSIHKLTSSKNRPSSNPSPPLPSNLQPQVGEYSKEKLLELSKNARPLGKKPDRPSEPVIVLKGLVKPVTDSELKPRKEEEEVDEDEFAKLGIMEGKGSKALSSAIPSQADINAIKAQRERRRQSRAPAPDFISLDSGGVMATRVSDGGSSDDEDHEFQGRIALFGDKDDGKPKKGVFEGIEERAMVVDAKVVEDEDDEDEEERKWEEEQFRKGLGKRIEVIEEVAVNRGASGIQPVVAPATSIYPASVPHSSLGETMSIAQKAEVATRALKENILKLKATHTRTLTSLAHTDENLVEALSDITTLEKSLELAGEKYVFMQELRDFISIMCDFLKDKALLIEELEEEMQKLHEKRAAAVEERRAADIADESGEL